MTAKTLNDDFHLVTLNFFNDLTVDSVRAGGQSLQFTHSDDVIEIELPDTLASDETFFVNTFYHGTPQSYGWGTFGFDQHGNGPVVWTLSQPDFARSWWPCKDITWDKADSADIWLTVDESLIATSEGTLEEVIDNSDGTLTYKWHHGYPIPTYLFSMAISNYVTFSHWYHADSGDSMEVNYWVFPQDSLEAEIDFSITVPAIEVLVDAFDIEYPYLDEKYAHSAFPWGGAMEHATNTSYGSFLITGDHQFDWLLVHEVAHMWWGDMVTCYDWINTWLNEGFATYCEALWFESIGGAGGLREYMLLIDEPSGNFQGPIYDNPDPFDDTVYDKGGWALHMLRHVVGDSVFFDILYEYGTHPSYAFASATTEDFLAVCEDVSGQELDWFFEEWIYGVNRPNYEYWWFAEEDQGSWDVHLHIDQVQTNAPPFKMPIDIELEFAFGETTVVVWDSLAAQDFTITVSEEPGNLYLDPMAWVLKRSRQIPPVGIGGDGLEGPGLPRVFSLAQNHPNPFNPHTTISYTIGSSEGSDNSEEVAVRLTVFDARGRLVAKLIDTRQEPGTYQAVWDGREISGSAAGSGIYFYVLEAGDFKMTKKMVLLK
jgi:aminopeptidase N